MNNKPSETIDDDEMLPEYDFSGGVRGKHAAACRAGYTLRVTKPDGTAEEREAALPEGVVVLDPDVRAYFPDSDLDDLERWDLVLFLEELPEDVGAYVASVEEEAPLRWGR